MGVVEKRTGPREHQLAVLRGLRDNGWQCTTELADETGLPPYAVRAALEALSAERKVRRGRAGHWGEYEVMPCGLEYLAASDQLELR